MTIGSDQLDEWGRRLIECDELYRELKLLIRINPEGYSVDDDALAIIGVANADGQDDGGILHPIAFAKQWAWHLASEARTIPPITDAWTALIRYVNAHLHYLSREDREDFHVGLKRVRGLLGALVNENRLAQGEAEDRQAINARQAREELRERATQVDQPLTRSELHTIWPELVERHWQQLRDRKKASPAPPAQGLYKPSWVAEIVGSGDPDLMIGGYANEEHDDVYDDRRRIVSYEALREAIAGR